MSGVALMRVKATFWLSISKAMYKTTKQHVSEFGVTECQSTEVCATTRDVTINSWIKMDVARSPMRSVAPCDITVPCHRVGHRHRATFAAKQVPTYHHAAFAALSEIANSEHLLRLTKIDTNYR